MMFCVIEHSSLDLGEPLSLNVGRRNLPGSETCHHLWPSPAYSSSVLVSLGMEIKSAIKATLDFWEEQVIDDLGVSSLDQMTQAIPTTAAAISQRSRNCADVTLPLESP